MADVFGTTLTDLQAGRNAADQTQNQREAQYRDFLATLSQQRNQNQQAKQQLAQQNQQYYAGLGQNDRQFNQEMALRRYAAQSGNDQFNAELDLKKKTAQAQEDYMRASVKNASIQAVAQLASALNNSLSNGQKVAAINGLSNQANQLQKMALVLKSERQKNDAMIGQANQDFYVQLKSGMTRLFGIAPDRKVSDVLSKPENNPERWLINNYPDLVDKAKWDGRKFILVDTPAELETKSQLDSVRNKFDQYINPADLKDPTIQQSLGSLNGLLSYFNLPPIQGTNSIPSYVPSSAPSPAPSQPSDQNNPLGLNLGK